MPFAHLKECAQTKRKWHHSWCEDDTCALGWGVVMHQVVVWAKAADHHGASGIAFSSATRVILLTQKVSQKYVTFLRKSKIKIMDVAKPLLNSQLVDSRYIIEQRGWGEDVKTHTTHPHQHYVTQSVLLAKNYLWLTQGRPMLQDRRIVLFQVQDLIFSLLPGLSLPTKGEVTSEKTKNKTT